MTKPSRRLRRAGFAVALAIAALGYDARKATATPAENTIDYAVDYQEHTGFVLGYDDRVLPFADASAWLASAVGSKSDQGYDAEDFFRWLEAHTPESRKSVRVVRFMGDAPVYLTQGWAILPDAQDAPVAIDAIDPATFCRDNARCIPLSRQHPQNRNVNALALVARTIIVRGRNETKGLSIVTVTENLMMPATAKDILDLSARQDPAPSFAEHAGSYDVGDGAFVDVNATAIEDGDGYRWPAHLDDLTWQFQRARALVPDNVGDVDNCPKIAAASTEWSAEVPLARCKKQRNARGLAGLPGGSWLAFTYRATGIRAISKGQPGGSGGKGVGGVDPVRACGVEVACADTCNVHDPIETKDPSCQVSCKYEPQNLGQTGGQAGPGGDGGFVRMAAVTHVAPCGDFSPAALATGAAGGDALDRRCADGQADDGDPTKVDCESPACLDDQNVSVCDASVDRLTGYSSPNARRWADWLASLTKIDVDRLPSPVPDLSHFTRFPLEAFQFFRAPRSNFDAYLTIASDRDLAVVSNDGTASPMHATGPTLTIPASIWTEGLLVPNGQVANLDRQILDANPEPLASCGAPIVCRAKLWPYVAALSKPKNKTALQQLWARAAAQGTETLPDVTLTPVLGRGVFGVLAQSGPLAVLLDGAPWSLVGRIDGVVRPIRDFCVDDVRFRIAAEPGANGASGVGGDPTPAKRLCHARIPNVKTLCHAVAVPRVVAPTNGSGEIGDRFEVVYWPFTDTGSCEIPETVTWPAETWVAVFGRKGPTDTSHPDLASSEWRFLPPVEVAPGSRCIPESERYWKGQSFDLCAPLPPHCGAPAPLLEGAGNHWCTGYAGPKGKLAPTPPKPPESAFRYWKRADWARALHGANGVELRRRLGKANSLFKDGDAVGARAKYLATRRWIGANQGSVDCSLGDSFDSLSDPMKRICSLRLEAELRLVRVGSGTNFFGYPPQYAPPPGATFGELHRLAKNELDKASAQRALWATLGGVLRGEAKLDSTLRAQIDADVATSKLSYAPGGSLAKELADRDEAVALLSASLAALQASIASDKDELSKLQIRVAGEPDPFVKVVEVAAVAAASYFGGVWGGALAAGAMKATDTAPTKAGEDPNKAADAKGEQLGDKLDEKISAYLNEAIKTGNEQAATSSIGAIEIVGDKTYLKITVQMKLLEALRLGREFGRAWHAREITLAKILETQQRVLALQAAKTSFDATVIPGHLPAFEAQAAILDAAYLSTIRAVDAGGEYFFLARRAAERDAVPWNPTLGASDLTLAEQQDLLDAGPTKAAACFARGVKEVSLGISLANLDCFRDRLDLIRNYVEAVEASYLRTGTLTVDVPITAATEVTEAGKDAHRFTVDLTREAVPALERAQKIERVAIFVLTDGTDALRIPVRIRRPMNDTYWVGTTEAKDVYQSFSFGVPASPGTAALGILLDTAYEEVGVTACAGPASAVEVVREDCTLRRRTSSTGAVTVDPLIDRSLLGRIEVEVDRAALGTRTPEKLRLVIGYRYRL